MIGLKENYHLTAGFLWEELIPFIEYKYKTNYASNYIVEKLVEKIFPFHFKVQDETLEQLNENNWCYRNIREGWTRKSNMFYFEEKADAALFKLFWYDSDNA